MVERIRRAVSHAAGAGVTVAFFGVDGSRVDLDFLFRRETGAVAAQFHDPPAVEPYSPTLVGATRGIVLGKKRGAESIRLKAEELGLDVAEDDRKGLLEAVKARAISKGGLVTDDEFRALVTESEAAAS